MPMTLLSEIKKQRSGKHHFKQWQDTKKQAKGHKNLYSSTSKQDKNIIHEKQPKEKIISEMKAKLEETRVPNGKFL